MSEYLQILVCKACGSKLEATAAAKDAAKYVPRKESECSQHSIYDFVFKYMQMILNEVYLYFVVMGVDWWENI